MSREEIREPLRYYSIVSGKFHTQVSKDDPSAVRRDWTSADGKTSGTKYERIAGSLFGRIEQVSFVDGKYGLQLLIKLDPTADNVKPVIALNMASREAEGLLKRLPNIDLNKEVRFRPYDFEDGGEDVRGIAVTQPDEMGDFTVKIGDFFSSKEKLDDGSYKYSYLNGFPKPEGDTEEYSKDDWKLYFLTCRKFLVNYTKENICPKFRELPQNPPRSLEEQNAREYPKDDINPDDIPF